jgi:hypothetical protein
MVTGVGNATLYQGNLVKGYLTIPKKPGVRPISIPHPLEAVRQLLAVIKEFLLFRFKGLKCLLFVVFLLLSVIVGQPV